jgi:hypothetical protein
VFAIVFSCTLLAGLFGALIVIQRRRDNADRARPTNTRPDPQVVDRPFDPTLCAFCDQPGRNACPACGRKLCGEHRRWPHDRFCWPCEAEWNRGARKRAFWIAPIVIVLACSLFALVGLLGALSSRMTFGALVAPIAAGAPAYLWLERRMRRRFRPQVELLAATARDVSPGRRQR